MTEAERIITTHRDGHDLHSGHAPVHDHASGGAMSLRILELETENLRLQRLVAELLLKNQQLRREV